MAEVVFSLVLLSMAVASIAWTVTQEEIFREPREWCDRKCRSTRSIAVRKFLYIFTCEYCFSHWVTLVLALITGFRLVYDDWRGSLIAFLVLPWLANQWMSIYRRLRVDIKHENALAEKVENEKPGAKKPPR